MVSNDGIRKFKTSNQFYPHKQRNCQAFPKLFQFAQLLLAVQPNEVKYATTNTPAKFWSVWKEQTNIENKVKSILESDTNGQKSENRLPTEQDRILYSLCRPERVLELAYKYIVFDGKVKKIARYQQYFWKLRFLKQNDFPGNGQEMEAKSAEDSSKKEI